MNRNFKRCIRNANVRETIVKERVNVVIIVILKNIIWIWDNGLYLWIQEKLQEEYNNNKGVWTELLWQVCILYVYHP